VNGRTEAAPSRAVRVLRAAVASPVKVARVAPHAIQQFFSDGCPQHAAAIAYRVLFSIAPLAIVLVSIFGLVLRDDSIRRAVVNTIVDALPVSRAGRKDVEDAITSLAMPSSAIGFASLFVFAWAATGMMTAIRRGLESAMGVSESRPMARGKVVDLLLILGAAALVLLSAGLTLLGDRVERASVPLANTTGLGAGTLAGGLLRAESFGVSVVAVMLLYRFVPARGLRLRDGLVGAIVTAALLQAIALASGLIYDRTTKLTVVYGSLTTGLVFLYSVYLYSSVVLLGAEVATAWARPPVEEAAPPLVQLKRFASGLFVSQGPAADDDRASDLRPQSTRDDRRSADDP
jgi:membrane protein